MASFTPYPYQRRGADALLAALDRCGSGLDASIMGSGKTFTSLIAAKAAGFRVGVVCIKQARQKWADAASLVGVECVFVENREKLRTGRTPWVSRSGKKFSWKIPHGTVLIFDECHKDSAPDSLNAAMLSGAIDVPTFMLSATVAESPLQMRAIGHQLGFHNWKNYWAWAKRMGATDGQFGGLEFAADTEWGQACLHDLHQQMFPWKGFRVDEAELEGVLPEHIISNDPIDLSDADRKKIKDAYKEMEADGSLISLTRSLKQRMLIETIKVPYMVEEARNAVAEGGCALVFLNFQASIDAAKELVPGVPVIDGRVSDADRERARSSFQNGECDILLINTAAGGQSIDLQDLDGDRPRVQLLSPQYGAKVDEQATGRAARAGAKSRVITRRLYAADTLEDQVIKNLSTKHTAISIINKGNKMSEDPAKYTVKSTAAELEHAEREHAEHSPSSLPNKAKCSGWRNDPTSDKGAADRGSLGHEAVEKRNLTLIPPEDEALRSAAQKCIDYFDGITPKGAKVYKEIRVHYADQFGHLDHFIHCGSWGILGDFKFAHNFYEAKSLQFKAYVLGLWHMFPEIDKIEVHVAHPFLDTIDVEVFDRTDEDMLTSEVTAVVEAAKRSDPTAFRTGKHCEYCGHKASCPALSQLAVQVGENYRPADSDLVIPEGLDPANITDPVVIAKAKELAPILKKWCEKVDERALEMRLHEGIEIPGYDLAERSAPFKITNAQAAWEVVKDQITPEAFAGCAEVKIGELEKAIARVTPRGGVAKAKAALRDSLVDADAARVDGTSIFLKRSKVLPIEV